jgi:hypothetical protein
MDLEEISEFLAMTPRHSWKVGERRRTAAGHPLGGVYPITHWCSEAVEGQGFDMAEALSSHLLTLEAHRTFLSHFTSTGGSIECFVGWFTDGQNTGVTLDWELLSRLSALQIELGLDVYCGSDPSPDPSVDDRNRTGA